MKAAIAASLIVLAMFLVATTQAIGEEIIFTDSPVSISWPENPEPDVKDYGVYYRLYGSANPWEQIERTANIYTAWDTPSELQDRLYEFVIDADDFLGHRSGKSVPSKPAWIDSGAAPSDPGAPDIEGAAIIVNGNFIVNNY